MELASSDLIEEEIYNGAIQFDVLTNAEDTFIGTDVLTGRCSLSMLPPAESSFRITAPSLATYGWTSQPWRPAFSSRLGHDSAYIT